MFKTKIKEKYRTKPEKSSWNVSLGEHDYYGILTLGDQTLMTSEANGFLLVDIFNNKLEDLELVYDAEIVVKAKNEDYANRFAIFDEYKVEGYDRSSGPTKLKLVSTKDGSVHMIFPSRLRLMYAKDDDFMIGVKEEEND